MGRRRLTLGGMASIVLTAGVAGCGLGLPSSGGGPPAGATQHANGPAAAVSAAQRTHERAAPPSAAETTVGASPSPLVAIRSFVSAYINWTADDVTEHMRALAAGSVGQARSAMQLAAAQTAGDYELRQGGISNSGQIEAVAPQAGRPGRYVVVTLERTSASATDAYRGLRPAWHVAVAVVVKLSPGRWVLNEWQPES